MPSRKRRLSLERPSSDHAHAEAIARLSPLRGRQISAIHDGSSKAILIRNPARFETPFVDTT